jgi:hypothetical protein
MNSVRSGLLAASIGAAFLWCSTVRAEGGLLLDASALAEEQRATLRALVARARARDARVFERVEAIRDRVAARSARKRGRLVSVTGHFRALGRPALMPMLAMLALEARPRGSSSDAAWVSLRVGLLEAVGRLRDDRARPILQAILRKRAPEWPIDRAAAGALARLGDAAAARELIGMVRSGAPKQTAVLAEIGHCRRAVVADALAQWLAERPGPARALLLVRALSDVGNAWAWKTPVVRASGDERRVRPVAARALVAAFVAYSGHTRRAAGHALLVVDDPSTPTLLEAARAGASGRLALDLDRLMTRFARNPAR